MFDILQEILKIHLFLMSQKLKMQDCEWCGVEQIKCIFADMEIVEQGWSTTICYLK